MGAAVENSSDPASPPSAPQQPAGTGNGTGAATTGGNSKSNSNNSSRISSSDLMTVTHRSDLSTFFRVVRAALRPIRPRLATTKVRFPPGSPRLVRRPARIGRVAIRERVVDNGARDGDRLFMYDFETADKTGTGTGTGIRPPTHFVYYFCGGGFQAPPSPGHWKFCAHLAAELGKDAGHVTLVSYPLAPHSPAHISQPILRRWLASVLKEAAAKGHIVSLAGDSAGGNVALSLALWCADQLAAARRDINDNDNDYADADADADAKAKAAAAQQFARLRSVVSISPPTDMRNDNPEMAAADRAEPILSRALTDKVAAAWSQRCGDGVNGDGDGNGDNNGEEDHDEALLHSPNRADLAPLAASGIRVDGVVGTADILAPDALLFLRRCRDAGVRGDWLVWEGQMHCFPLTAAYGIREGREARKWVRDVLDGVTRAHRRDGGGGEGAGGGA
ncbi:Alpha/Beta hydrolase protein [Xylariaceae sp. FL0804]|nr:Alpha/Beta hydrolase protein [Xylariaceae sp. FL0804]